MDSANRLRVGCRANESDAKSGLSSGVVIEFGFGAVLADGEIETSIAVVIAECGSALLAVDGDPALGGGEGSESAVSIASQAEAAAAVVARNLRLVRKEILAEEQVEIAIAIDVADADRKGRRHLRFDGKWPGLEVIAPIEEEGRFEPVSL